VRIGKHGEGSEAVEVPIQFCYFRNSGLSVKNGFLDIQTESQPGCCDRQCVLLANGPIFLAGKRMKIRNEDERFFFAVLLNQLNSRNNRS
jgi:hypothetical protein